MEQSFSPRCGSDFAFTCGAAGAGFERASEAEANLCDRASLIPDPVCGSALFRLEQIAENFCVGTRYRKNSDFAGYDPDLQSAR